MTEESNFLACKKVELPGNSKQGRNRTADTGSNRHVSVAHATCASERPSAVHDGRESPPSMEHYKVEVSKRGVARDGIEPPTRGRTGASRWRTPPAPVSARALCARAGNPRRLRSTTRWRFRKGWWPGTESNRRHGDFQSPALPTELPGPERRRIRPTCPYQVKAE